MKDLLYFALQVRVGVLLHLRIHIDLGLLFLGASHPLLLRMLMLLLCQLIYQYRIASLDRQREAYTAAT